MLKNKYVVSPGKKAINKIARDNFGTYVFNKKRDLTMWDIVSITSSYVFSAPSKYQEKDGHEVYTSWEFPVFTWHSVYFCDDGVRTEEGIWNTKYDFLSYKDLRNDEDITMSYLKSRFSGFQDELCNTLMELREA